MHFRRNQKIEVPIADNIIPRYNKRDKDVKIIFRTGYLFYFNEKMER